jgi:ATP-dependent RNA helicase DDX54/DBP10
VGLKDYIYVKLDREFSLPENMMVHFLLCSNDHKLSALVFLLKRIGLNEATIIFASTKYLVDLIVYTLEKFGISAVNIYGKMDATDRRDQLQLFRSNQSKILVVTDLASRGLDIPFVSNVIQYDYPSKPKVFIHRAGRTARAGRKGWVYSLIAPDEIYFISETMLFAGRHLVNEGDLEDVSRAFYGQVPVDCIESY